MYTVTINVQYTCYSTGLKIKYIIIACFAQREKPPWGAEPGFELGPAIKQASALPTEPCCTLSEPCCTLSEPCCTLLNHAAPYMCLVGDIRNFVHEKSHEIPRNFTELYVTEFAGIPPELQSIPHGIRNRRK
jgi:hypothetical protein